MTSEHGTLSHRETMRDARRARGFARHRSALAAMLAASALGLTGTLATPGPAVAEPVGIEGAWIGSGSVNFASGGSENAKCRARYSRGSKSIYVLRATCATTSGRVEQTATLRRVDDNRYAGSFYNREFDIAGAIEVIIRGGIQTVRLTSAAGTALLRLSR